MLGSCHISTSAADTSKIAIIALPSILSTKLAIFYGDLGAGKTLMCQAIIGDLCKDENLIITSPTFNIVKIYNTRFGQLHHYDLYRVKHLAELEEIGLIDDLRSRSNICLIEWPQIAEQIIPKNCIKIDIAYMKDSKRKILINSSSA
jgi:tRNA threonylcarbamoyl adenosine modification protein YjeE